jgi:predicted metal-dependent HD superfamily phosphohydrolase
MVAHLTEDLREDLLARWSESHRKHHNVAHLHEMLDAIGVLADDGVQFDREAVELAAWFHDAVYEIGRDDNEERSADLARELLESSPIRDEVSRLVLLTKAHQVADDDINGAVLSDADLSVLARDPQRYRAYAQAVREEYAAVPDVHNCSRHCWTARYFTPSQHGPGGRTAPAATSPTRSAISPADLWQVIDKPVPV